MSIKQNDTPKFFIPFEQIFEQSQNAISVFALDNTLITCNPAFEKLYGWTEDECKGKFIHFYPETEIEAVKERHERLIQGESFEYKRVIEQRKDGSTFHAEINMTPIFNEHNQVVAISYITHDITYRLELERKRLEIIRLQNTSKIATILAHEIRNPMTAVTGFIQMMNQDSANPYKHFTPIMADEVAIVNQIITDFLALAPPTHHNQTTFSIMELLEEVMNEYAVEFAEKKVICHLHPTTHEPLLYGNKSSLKHVFLQIFSNSFDAMEESGQIDLTVDILDQSLRITIADNGSGMSPSVVEAIDQPFFTTKEKNTGLGILISKKIIFDYRGTLEIESVQNVGTKVIIHLPLAKESLHQ